MNESPEDLACRYVLDQLDAVARADFESRLLHEPELAAHVRALEEGLAQGVRSLPPVEPPSSLLQRIEAGIEPARAPSPVLRPLWFDWARWGIAAVIALSLGILAVQSLRRPRQPVFVVVGLDADRNTFTELPQTAAAKDPDARFIQLASLAENYWRKPGDAPVPPAATAPGSNRGYALFDPGSQQGFIAIEQIPALASNQRYHLWVADALTGRVRDAGTLPLVGLSRGLYSFALEADGTAQTARPQLFITAEDITPAAVEPRGKVVLGQRTF